MTATAAKYRRRRLGALAILVIVIAAGRGIIGVARSNGGGSTVGTASTTTATASNGHHRGTNIYAHIGAGSLSSAVMHDPERVYVPDGVSNTVTVIDERTRRVLTSFPTAGEPQHVVPAFDLRTLWVLDNRGDEVVPIDPSTGTPGASIAVDDPYNLYFTPDGSSAIVVAEARRRLDFRDPHTMVKTASLSVPECDGINHADYDASFAYMITTCEFSGRLAKIDIAHRRVIGMLQLGSSSMPQDVRAGPDGRRFYVADMQRGGVWVIDGKQFAVTDFIRTGIGAHGITPSRNGRLLYIANRGSDTINGVPHGPGSVSVLDTDSDTVTATWPVPGGGSPDMGNLDVTGGELWLSGRFDSEVYVFDTVRGVLAARIPVGAGPHGLAVWPQPGRFSLGHTGNMR